MANNTTKSKKYVIVRHNPTGRSFSLDRAYELIDPDVEDCLDPNYISVWQGWFPTMERQSPKWAKDISRDEFTAYWYDVK